MFKKIKFLSFILFLTLSNLAKSQPIEEIQKKIDEFVLFLKTTETQHKSKKSFLEHFINWVTKKNNSEKNGTQQVNASFGAKKVYKFDAARIIETNLGKA